MSNNLFLSLTTSGLAANRPAKPEIPSSPLYYATDTGVLTEWTGAAWVVIGSYGVQGSLAAPIIPSLTHTIAGATKITAGNVFAASANIGDALALPANPQLGQEVLIYNSGAAAAAVFPGEATTIIDAGGAGASATLTNAKYALFVCTVATVGSAAWASFGGAGHSV